MAADSPERVLPLEPQDCRRKAEDGELVDDVRMVWALLAIAGELAEVRRELRRRR